MFYVTIASGPLFIFLNGFHDWLNIAATIARKVVEVNIS